MFKKHLCCSTCYPNKIINKCLFSLAIILILTNANCFIAVFFFKIVFRNDAKAQKNGSKKTVYWVKKKPRDEDGKVKGETWTTSQQYIGDWKDNKKPLLK
jgi:hypothetical protein